MKILIDTDDNNEIIGPTEKETLTEAVTEYLQREGFWDSQYYGDGKLSLTGKEYVERGMHEQDFKLQSV